MLHVAVLPRSIPLRASFRSMRPQRWRWRGVHYVLTGDELAAATDPLRTDWILRRSKRHPLGWDKRDMPVNGWSPWSPTAERWPRTPSNRCALPMSRCRSCWDAEEGAAAWQSAGSRLHGSNVLLDRTFVWGEVEKHFVESRAICRSASPGTQLDRSDRNLWRRCVLGSLARDARRLGLDPDAEIPGSDRRALRIPANGVRVHQDVDVGGSYGVKRGIKQTVLVAHLARRLGRPVRLIEDRLDI